MLYEPRYIPSSWHGSLPKAAPASVSWAEGSVSHKWPIYNLSSSRWELRTVWCSGRECFVHSGSISQWDLRGHGTSTKLAGSDSCPQGDVLSLPSLQTSPWWRPSMTSTLLTPWTWPRGRGLCGARSAVSTASWTSMAGHSSATPMSR